MARPRPPASLEDLRALLDRASARRSFITGDREPSGENGGGRTASQGTRCRTVIAEADHDFVAVVIADGDRLDTGALATTLGARRVHIVGPQTVRPWLGAPDGRVGDDGARPLAWDEVPLITQLPTVIDQALLGRAFLLGGTGDTAVRLRIAPGELRRVTLAVTAPIAHRARRGSA